VILGGDVIDEIDLFFEKAVESARRRVLPPSMKDVSIVRGRLRTTAGAYGAAVFAKEHLLQVKEQQILDNRDVTEEASIVIDKER
jgi:hypothetical protein